MRGFNTIWQPGYDHAGIAIQNVIERGLAKEGLTRHDLGREAFVERTWAWLREYGGVIMGQLRRLGASLDYRRERMTMDDGYSAAVMRWFVHLDKGCLYRGPDRQLVPALRERDLRSRGQPRETDDTLYTIRYPLADGSGHIRIATVRPPTMLADVAVAVHPDDDRYATWSARRRWFRSSAGAADHRRRARRPRVRHRRGEDHARSRPDGLGDRP